jgi:hypothetical protein
MTDESFCAACETRKHKSRVMELLTMFVVELLKRGNEHDDVKLESPEREIFDEYTEKLSVMTFGTPEYEECRKAMGPALDHHYARCRHHPEHYDDGIDGMTLIDLVEMLCDCKAASERHNDGNIMRSIDVLSKRFDIAPQLAKILKNTIIAFSLKE